MRENEGKEKQGGEMKAFAPKFFASKSDSCTEP